MLLETRWRRSEPSGGGGGSRARYQPRCEQVLVGHTVPRPVHRLPPRWLGQPALDSGPPGIPVGSVYRSNTRVRNTTAAHYYRPEFQQNPKLYGVRRPVCTANCARPHRCQMY